MEGLDTSSAMLRVWRSLAASEARLYLMEELMRLGIGLAEVEEFNIGQISKLRTRERREKRFRNLSQNKRRSK